MGKKAISNFVHPEQEPGEVWLSNADREIFASLCKRYRRINLRIGVTPYTEKGERIDKKCWRGAFPVFINRNILEQMKPNHPALKKAKTAQVIHPD